MKLVNSFSTWFGLLRYSIKSNLMNKNQKICFIVPYPLGEAPSQRFRFEQYLDYLKNDYTIHSFFDLKTFRILYKKGYIIQKIIGTLAGFVKRLLLLFKLNEYSLIFIHREASPFGPPIFEWVIKLIFNKKIIYDFDDAIWLNDHSESKLIRLLKWKKKVGSICKWSHKISVGNSYLYNYAKSFNSNSFIIPTTIDTENYHNPSLFPNGSSSNKRLIIGWTGTHSTLLYLQPIIPVLQKLEKEFNFEFRVIANKNPELNLKHFTFAKWKKESEIEDLLQIDIGIMPLTNDQWSLGKCGFKALQFMALNIPVAISPVGVNAMIIEDNINGYLCENNEEWSKSLSQLLSDAQLRKNIGQKGREKVIENYSVLSVKDSFLSLFELS